MQVPRIPHNRCVVMGFVAGHCCGKSAVGAADGSPVGTDQNGPHRHGIFGQTGKQVFYDGVSTHDFVLHPL